MPSILFLLNYKADVTIRAVLKQTILQGPLYFSTVLFFSDQHSFSRPYLLVHRKNRDSAKSRVNMM